MPIYSHAQFESFKNKVLEKSKKLAKDKTTAGIDAERDKLDSTDFNYAITVIDNSGIMNIRDAKETIVKSASTAAVVLSFASLLLFSNTLFLKLSN